MPVKKLSKKLPKKLPKNLPQKKKNRTRKQKGGGNNAGINNNEYYKNPAEKLAMKKAQWAKNLNKNDKYTKKMKYWIKKKEECYNEELKDKNQEYYSELSATPLYNYRFDPSSDQYKKYYGLFGKCKYFDTYIYKIKNYEYKIKANLPERKYIRKTDVNKIYNDLNNKPDVNKPLLTGFFKLYNELLENNNNNNNPIFNGKEIEKLREKIAEVIVALRIIRNGGGTYAVINEINKINLYNANKLNKKDFIIYLLKLAKNLLAK